MDYIPDFKPPTSSEYVVLAIGAATLLIGLGLAGFGFALFAAPANQQAVAVLLRYSAASVGLGILIALAYWIARRIMD